MKYKKKMVLLGYRHPACRLYTPQRNKKKLALLAGFVGVCLITPATNWMIFVVGALINKLNPLWIYQ